MNLGEVGEHAAAGAVLGPIASKLLPSVKIPGLSSGRNSFKAVGDAAKTKIERGVASQMSAQTAAKAAAGTATNDAARSVASDKVEQRVTRSCAGNATGATKCD